jgi:hypothetical protein
MKHIHFTLVIDFIHFSKENDVDLINKYAQPPETTIIIMSTKRIHAAQDMSSLFFTKKQS